MNRGIFSYLRIAARVALNGQPRDYALGAVGIRSDGAIVSSFNGAARIPTPNAHAEARLARKLDNGSEVYVARVLRCGSFALSRPCARCQAAMRARGVRRAYYSISDNEYGVMQLG